MGYNPYLHATVPRRQAILRFTPALLLDVLRGRCDVADSLPEGCHLRSIKLDQFSDTVEFLLEHNTFPEIYEGCLPPIQLAKLAVTPNQAAPELTVPPLSTNENVLDPVFAYNEA
jgi:hypothetical protein